MWLFELVNCRESQDPLGWWDQLDQRYGFVGELYLEHWLNLECISTGN